MRKDTFLQVFDLDEMLVESSFLFSCGKGIQVVRVHINS